MKKLYILTLGLLTAGSSMAAVRQTASVNQIPVQKLNAVAETSVFSGVKRVAPQADAVSVSDIEGAYNMSSNSGLQNGVGEFELYISVDNEATGDVSITGLFYDYAIKGNFDASTSKLSVYNNQDLGEDPVGDKLVFYLKGVNDEGKIVAGASDLEATVAEYNNGVFAFPQFEIWTLGDPDSENLGYWTMNYNVVLTVIDPNYDPNEGWSFYSTGVFEDGWMVPGYNAVPSEYPWTVNIQKNDEIEGLYRLDCPYTAQGCPFSGGKDGYIVFSIEDPDFVTVLPDFYSGVNNGSNKLYFFNIEGFWTSFGIEKDEIIAELDDQVNGWSSFSEGVVEIYNCRFDIQSPCQTLYSWVDGNDQSLVDLMEGKITFDKDPSAVGSIDSEVLGEVEYYNLQGVKLDRPAKGINIRVANGKATKVMTK